MMADCSGEGRTRRCLGEKAAGVGGDEGEDLVDFGNCVGCRVFLSS